MADAVPKLLNNMANMDQRINQMTADAGNTMMMVQGMMQLIAAKWSVPMPNVGSPPPAAAPGAAPAPAPTDLRRIPPLEVRDPPCT